MFWPNLLCCYYSNVAYSNQYFHGEKQKKKKNLWPLNSISLFSIDSFVNCVLFLFK